MAKHLAQIGMRVVVCDCGITWAAPVKWFEEKENDHSRFYCPNGCHRHFPPPQESEEEKLKRQLKDKSECCLRAEPAAVSMEKSAIAYKGHATRLKNKLKDSEEDKNG